MTKKHQAKTYIGSPCKKGHTLRYVSTCHCVECSSAQMRERTRKQREANGVVRRIKNFGDQPKLCPACDTVKPPEDYYKTRFGTLFTDCKACLKIYRAEMWRTKYKKSLGKSIEAVLR